MKSLKGSPLTVVPTLHVNVCYPNVSAPYRTQAPSPPVRKPFTSNVAARSVDVSWEPPADYWLALAITGYEARLSGMPSSRVLPFSIVTVNCMNFGFVL